MMMSIDRFHCLSCEGPRLRAAPLVMLTMAALAGAGCAATGRTPPPPAAPTAQEAITAGDEAARGGELDRALAHYLRAVDAASAANDASAEVDPADIWLRVGAASEAIGQRDRALNAYLRAISLDPTRAEAHEGAGLDLLARGRSAEALEHLTAATRLEPRRWRSHNGLGVLADQAGDHEEAIAHYRTALDLKPGSPMLVNNIGYSRFLANDLEQAARDFYAATELDPNYQPAWSNLGMVYARRGWYADALVILAKVSDDSRAHNDVGAIALERGDLVEAERLLSEAVRLSPTYYATASRNLQFVRSRMQADGG
jgi:Flp pilus assembly protein TadD